MKFARFFQQPERVWALWIGFTFVSAATVYWASWSGKPWVLESMFGLFVVFAIGSTWLLNHYFQKPIALLAKRQVDAVKATVNPQLYEISEKIRSLYLQIEAGSTFIKAIGDGNLNASYPNHGEEDDSLRDTLLHMRDQMKELETASQQRRWTNEGISKFAEILRSNGDDAQLLYDNIISQLVKYLGAIQGGLFVINEDQEQTPFLEMVACYAYDRKKYMEKRVNIGEGLLGQAYLEREYVHLRQIPENYTTITSGLGHSHPKSLLIVPLMVNEEVQGLIEVGSLNLFDTYQIEFLTRLGESIAATLFNTRRGEKMRRLLEDSQQQAEMMRAQEEEMRQNMEELQATQEQQARLQQELQKSEQALKDKLQQLEEARRETEAVKETEGKRMAEQIEKRNILMKQFQERTKKREQELLEMLKQKEEEIKALKSAAST